MINYDQQYNTMTFDDVWEKYEDLLSDYQDSGFDDVITEDSMKILFLHLSAEYKNSPIINRDVNQFKFRVFSLIYQYGGEWEKKLTLQKRILALTEDELKLGGTNVINQALNPSTEPSASTTEELDYVNQQSVSKSKRALIDALNLQWESINSNITEPFIKRFRKLFSKFGSPMINPVYNID